MFSFKFSNQPPSISNSKPVQKRHTSSTQQQGRTFIDAIRRIANQATRFFKTAAAPQTQATHTMREVTFASSPRVGKQVGFPNQVEHRFTGGLQGSPGTPGINALLPELSKSIQNKQGFVYLFDDTSPSPMATFANDLQNQDAISIGNGCRIIGAFRTPEAIASVYSPQWTLQVYDSSLETTLEIPVTEVPLNHINNPANVTGHLLHVKNCMDSHLRALPEAFKDSPACPAIICPQNPRLAQLITAQEECLGRQYRGELRCETGVDWIYAAEETLKTISPESPHFVCEESVDFESFFTRNGIHAFANNQVPYSMALAGENTHDPVYIRAFKRHIPNTEPPTRTTPFLKTPAPSLNWLASRNQGLAFKEPLLQMQCASQAINCLLQRHEVTPDNVASFMAQQKLEMLGRLEIPTDTQVGLMHPTVLRAISQGQSATISKAEFLGTTPDEICIATELAPTQSWRQLINIGAVERNQNWVQHADELSAINQMTITPEDWLSVQRGTEMRDLLALVNTTLENSRQPHQPLSMSHLNTRTQSQAIARQEDRARKFIEHGKDFPIIIRTGQQSGHYFTIVPDQHGNWLGLNALGTSVTGVQPCEIFCQAGQLAQTLQRMNATDILVPTPQLKSRN